MKAELVLVTFLQISGLSSIVGSPDVLGDAIYVNGGPLGGGKKGGGNITVTVNN